MICLAIVIEHWLVMDRNIDTDRHRAIAWDHKSDKASYLWFLFCCLSRPPCGLVETSVVTVPLRCNSVGDVVFLAHTTTVVSVRPSTSFSGVTQREWKIKGVWRCHIWWQRQRMPLICCWHSNMLILGLIIMTEHSHVSDENGRVWGYRYVCGARSLLQVVGRFASH